MGKRSWTLSHHVWRWFAIGKPWGRHLAGLRWFILAGFLVSLSLHFLAYFSVVPFTVFAAGFVWSIWYYHRIEAPWHGVARSEWVWWILLGSLGAWEIVTAVVS